MPRSGSAKDRGVKMSMVYGHNCVFVTGQAKPGKEDAITAVYNVFSLCLIIDIETDLIVDLACNVVMDETEDFIRGLLCGKNIVTEMDVMQQVVKCRFFALVQKALLVALKDVRNRYIMEFSEKGDDMTKRS